MSDLPKITGEEAVRCFEKFGFYLSRTAGSHHILAKNGHRFVLSVPVHKGQMLKTGTLRSLIRASGITVEQFRAKL